MSDDEDVGRTNHYTEIVSPRRITAATNVLTCLGQSRLAGRSAGEWAAGAIEQIEDPHLKILVRDAVQEWYHWEQRMHELVLMAKKRREAFDKPPKVTQRPKEGARDG